MGDNLNESLESGYNFAKEEDLGCWKRFLKSRRSHKKLYFAIKCLLKLATFIILVMILLSEMDDYYNRPNYIAVCQYVISDDLDFTVDENCTITVDEKEFTCDTEFGFKPYPSDDEDITDATFNGYPKFGVVNQGDLSFRSYYTQDTVYSNINIGNYTQASNTSYGDYMQKILSRRRTSRSIRYINLRSNHTNDTYEVTSEATEAQLFAENAGNNIRIFFYLWIAFNGILNFINSYKDYKERIRVSIPRPDFFKRIKYTILDNILETCVAAITYPVTLPKYGDCFNCSPESMCTKLFYLFMVIGFFCMSGFAFLVVTSRKDRSFSEVFLHCFTGCLRRSTNICDLCLSLGLYISMVCGFGAIILTIIITSARDWINFAYSGTQIFISFIYFFFILVGEKAETTEEMLSRV